MSRGRSSSPRQSRDVDMDVDNHSPEHKPDPKVIIVNNLTRNVVESHLKIIFSFYGEIVKIDLPLYGKSGQNRGKAALEFSEPAAAQRAVKHMNGGQLDGSTLAVELSDLPIRTSRSPARGGRGRGYRNGRDRPRSFSRSRSRTPRSRSRSRQPYRRRGGPSGDSFVRDRDSFRGRGFGRRGPPGRVRDDYYRPVRSRTRSRSPPRRGGERPLLPRRRSPSYNRGGHGGRRKSRSYSVRSSRSRTRSFSRSKSISRSRSFSTDSRYTRSRSRTRSVSRGRRTKSRSLSREDIRDSRSRSPK